MSNPEKSDASLKLSIVTTLYCSEEFVEEFYARIVAEAERITQDFEIIFVDDGSPDHSAEVVLKLLASDKRIRLIELSRNFGHHKAIFCGLSQARGELVFLIDVDLEEKPELLSKFYEKLQEDYDHIDVVYGYMNQRKGGLFERVFGSLFYFVLNSLTNLKIPKSPIMGRIMKADYVKALLQHQEYQVFIGGLMLIAGFHQVPIEVEKTSKGSTTYGFTRKILQALDAILSFSTKPLVCVCVFGILVAVISFVLLIWLVINRILYPEIPVGYSSLMLSIWFLGGITISSIGLVGLYVGKTFLQSKARPNYIVRSIHN
ncbi:MAG: glycosyltransferase family 2 protein [Verrucomicrobiota bacterium]